MLAGERARDLALVVFPAVFPRLIDAKDHDAMTALAETAECEVKKLVTQQGHSLLARVLYTGEYSHVQLPILFVEIVEACQLACCSMRTTQGSQ